jgi:hypothetical protein
MSDSSPSSRRPAVILAAIVGLAAVATPIAALEITRRAPEIPSAALVPQPPLPPEPPVAAAPPAVPPVAAPSAPPAVEAPPAPPAPPAQESPADPEKDAEIEKLKALMKQDKVSTSDIQKFIASKGVATIDMTPRQYNLKTIRKLVTQWATVLESIRKERETEKGN